MATVCLSVAINYSWAKEILLLSQKDAEKSSKLLRVAVHFHTVLPKTVQAKKTWPTVPKIRPVLTW